MLGETSQQAFKVIVALKSAKDIKAGTVRCAIQINDKVKFTILPQSEGQFFDIKDLNIGSPITVMFDVQSTGQRIGDLQIQVPPTVYSNRETELAEQFVLEYENDQGQNDTFVGRYYIIILNKSEILGQNSQIIRPIQTTQIIEEKPLNERKNISITSPTKQYIKSCNERSQERQKKDKQKQLLAETRFDPKQKQQSGSKSTKSLVKTTSNCKAPPKQNNRYETQNRQSRAKSEHQDNQDKPEKPQQTSPTPYLSFLQDSPFSKQQERSLIGNHSVVSLTENREQEKKLANGTQISELKIENNCQTLNLQLLKQVEQLENQIQLLQNEIRQQDDSEQRVRDEMSQVIKELRTRNVNLTQEKHALVIKFENLQSSFDQLSLETKRKDQQIEELIQKNSILQETEKVQKESQAKTEQFLSLIKQQQNQFSDISKRLLTNFERTCISE